jgi:peptidylprolyl isomerase
MKTKILLLAAALALSATAADAQRRRPGPPAAAAPAKPAQPTARDWRTPDPQNILVIETNKGRIIVEMVPQVAPGHVERIRELAQAHFYDGQTFFRVIDGFMDQTGDPQNTGLGGSDKPDIRIEAVFKRAPDTPWVQAADQVVQEAGFIGPLAVASQSMSLAPLTADGKVNAWVQYCPGVAGMARAEDPHSANSQFFLMRDHYPKLERLYTAWGRVLHGQDVVRAIKTGEPVPEPQDKMERVRLLSDLPANERPKIRVIDTAGAWFKAEVARQAKEKGAAFQACEVEIPVEVK